jgi:hypothetical protein
MTDSRGFACGLLLGRRAPSSRGTANGMLVNLVTVHCHRNGSHHPSPLESAHVSFCGGADKFARRGELVVKKLELEE